MHQTFTLSYISYKKDEINQTKLHIFSEQVFIVMNTKIHADTSYFNQDTTPSSATCQNAESRNYLVHYQQS